MIQQIEDAILAKIRAANVGYHCERYAGQAGSLEQLDVWVSGVQLPAVAVFYVGDLDTTPVGETRNRIERVSAQFDVWVITDTTRGYEDAMVAPTGLYAMLETVAGLLYGERLNLPIDPLYKTNQFPVAQQESTGRIIWAQSWIAQHKRSY